MVEFFEVSPDCYESNARRTKEEASTGAGLPGLAARVNVAAYWLVGVWLVWSVPLYLSAPC